MFIVALSKKGQGFLYKPTTAHEVKKKDAQAVASRLNSDPCFADMKTPEQEWTVHEIDQYDGAYAVAVLQRFFFTSFGLVRGCSTKRFFPEKL